MKQQKVVRTYPKGWTKTTEYLSSILSDGFHVVECHEVSDGILEYIVEKETDAQNVEGVK